MQNRLKSLKLIKSLVLRSGNSIPQIALATHHVYGDECMSRLKAALQSGYTHIDVARLYNNEQEIGKAIKKFGISRDKLFITAKLSFSEFGERGTRKACEDLLHNLGTGYVDMLMMHWPGLEGLSPNSPENPKIRLNTWNTMINLKKQGKTRDIGVANFLPRHLETFNNSSELPVINQIQLNPAAYDKQTIQYCKKHNIMISAISPLSRRPKVILENPYVVELSKKYDKTGSQIVLNWGISQEFVVCPKATTEDNIVSNMDIFDFSLTPEEIEKLTNLNIKVERVFNPETIKY